MRWTNAVATLIAALALAGPVSGQPAPRPLTLLDVPFISQSEALCGGAAAAMVLRYWGERGLSAESFAHLVDRSAAGIRGSALVGELRTRGWAATAIEGTRAQVEHELERGRPVLALIEDRPGTLHYIVIVAITPNALVFHDPARAPMRVMDMDEFARRWQRADRWMAVVVPAEARAAAEAPPPLAADAADTPCDRLVADGVARAQASDLDTAERSLTAALSCPGSAAMRELAGVRLLQRRWQDVEALSAAAVRVDPADAHAWRLLGTGRFLQDDRLGALDAWNQVAEPRIDLVSVAGLAHTRHQVVERLMDVSAGDVLTTSTFHRARRRLAELPSAAATRLEYVPVPSALAELRASVNERPLVARDVWSYAAIGLTAAARRELGYIVGSWSGGGERFDAAWRFWPNRPRAGVSAAAPFPWGGIWAAAAAWERQAFDVADYSAAERTSAEVRVSNWVMPAAQVTVRGGVDEWTGIGTFGRTGAALRVVSDADLVDARLDVDGWAGTGAFGSVATTITARSSLQRRGRIYVARAGAAALTAAAPVDTWFAGDTGNTRPILLRAHPVVDEGRLRVERLGRRIAFGSAEVQQWWPVSLVRAGAAVFADTAVTAGRIAAPLRRDLDVGIGARLALPAIPGTFRVDIARGLRDGATAWSFVYEP